MQDETLAAEGVRHGGNLAEARRLFPGAPEPWIDLSTGINPVAYPLGPLPDEALRRLPSPDDHGLLEGTAAAAYGAPDPGCVVAAPGTQALIQLLPRLRQPGRVAVVGPTYAEHARAWRAGGHHVVEATSLDAAEGAEVVVVVNPNNPDGRVVARDRLVGAAERLARRGGLLVVDEAFIDFEDAPSLVPVLPPAAIVLRSFGKPYGLAGLRLGFAVAPRRDAEALRRALGPWAVSGPAIAAGRLALADPSWLATAIRERRRDALRLDRSLSPVVDRVVGGTALFRLYALRDAHDLFRHLAAAGIWTRRFDEAPSWLRCGLPGSAGEWARLEAAVAAFR